MFLCDFQKSLSFIWMRGNPHSGWLEWGESLIQKESSSWMRGNPRSDRASPLNEESPSLNRAEWGELLIEKSLWAEWGESLIQKEPSGWMRGNPRSARVSPLNEENPSLNGAEWGELLIGKSLLAEWGESLIQSEQTMSLIFYFGTDIQKCVFTKPNTE